MSDIEINTKEAAEEKFKKIKREEILNMIMCVKMSIMMIIINVEINDQ